jgi:Polysaccharide lyase family 4, domain III
MFYLLIYRRSDDNSYKAVTWQIKFQLDAIRQNATYKLRVALASAALSELQVEFIKVQLLLGISFEIRSGFNQRRIMVGANHDN